MTINVYDSVTVSERETQLIPALTQVGLDITPGNTYQLTFNADISVGILKVYQGTQLIFDTTVLPIGQKNDIIYVTERVLLYRINHLVVFSSVTLSENMSFDIYYPINKYESVTISESVTITIV